MTTPQGGQPQGGSGTGSTDPQNAPQGGQDGGQGGNPPNEPSSTPQSGQSGAQAPPWGSDEQFDPQRAWNLIQNLRTEKQQAQTDRDTYKSKVTEFEDAGKTETERLSGDRDSWKGRAESAESKLMRLEVGLEKGLTPGQAARLVGNTADELKADADAFLAELPQQTGGQAPPSRRPTERMPSGGSDPETPPDEDPEKVAARVSRWR